jgi:hypothetical protein
MSYKNQIAKLNETLQLNASKIANLGQTEGNQKEIVKLISENVQIGKEISLLTRLDFEETYERLNLDDDR